MRWMGFLLLAGAVGLGMVAVMSGPQSKPNVPVDAPKLAVPFGQDAVVSSIHEYLDARLQDATASRRNYWDSLRRADGTFDLARARGDLRQSLGVPDDCVGATSGVSIERSLVESTEHARIERWTMKVCAGLVATGLVGRPHGRDRPPLVIAMHGTNSSPENVFGLPDPAKVEGEDYHHGFGRRLMMRGFVVFAPVLITETQADPLEGYNKTRNLLNQRALPLGLSINGLQVGMLVSSLPLLLRESGADPDRVAVYGISHGGQLAFYLMAIDERIRAAVISQWFEERAEKIAGRGHPDALWRYHHTGHNFYFGMLLHFTDIDVANLIVPRGLFIEAGREDRIRAVSAAQTFPALQAVYQQTGAPDGAVCIEVAPDAGHEIVMNMSATFLDRWLLDLDVPLNTYCPLNSDR